ncbi:AraC family transcriptional regulator [Amycolatopsis sp. NPDC006131]|uniref:AraC family transcriptional regulator n=1 Tax=Amycolatopsis sp. NPDC006131 TaxID=3156731 RepID=UPI0033BDE49A
MRAAIELIQAHPERNLTEAELAEAVGATARVLRGFRQVMGTSPGAHLRAVRLPRVREVLMVGGAGTNVTDVATR